MRQLTAWWRLLRVLVHGVHGLWVVLLRLPGLDAGGRQERVRWWSARLLRVMGIGMDSSGALKPGAKLLVANHVSWLDIMAIHCICPEARFVSKADVQAWPLLGRLVAAGGTLYIQRERPRDAMRVVHQMADALKAGDTVAVFPEGTTADGHQLLAFHANLLQAAITTQTPVQPIALRWSDRLHAISPSAEYLGDTSLAQSMWRLVCAEGLRVRLCVLPPQGTAHADRRSLALHLQGLIEAALPPVAP